MPARTIPGQVPNQLALLRAAQTSATRVVDHLNQAIYETHSASPTAFDRTSDAYAESMTVTHALIAILLLFERELAEPEP